MSWDKFSEIYCWELNEANPNQNKDKKFWLELALDKGCPILEIAAGDGRITKELIKTGCKITAMDISEKMIKKLNSLKSKSLETYVADMRNFKLDKKFRLIIVGYFSFQLILKLNEQIRFLQNMRSMLSEDGILGIDIYPCVCEGGDSSENKEIYARENGNKLIKMFSSYKIDRLNLIKSWKDYYEIYDKRGNLIEKFENLISLKECSPDYMKLLINNAGLKIHRVFGSFDKEEVTENSENIIYLLKKS